MTNESSAETKPAFRTARQLGNSGLVAGWTTTFTQLIELYAAVTDELDAEDDQRAMTKPTRGIDEYEVFDGERYMAAIKQQYAAKAEIRRIIAEMEEA